MNPNRTVSTYDDESLERLLREHDPAIRRDIERAIPVRWRALLAADDVMQQTWLDAFLHIDSVESGEPAGFAAWLHRIAVNNLNDAIRRLEADKRGGSARPVELAGGSSCRSLVEMIFGQDSHTPSRIARENEAEAALRTALEALPHEYRQAVQLHDLEGRPIHEIAALLNRSEGAIHMLRSRAHQQLREMLMRKNAVFRDFA
jgi:RNA polymerase sigma-70 factor (ECF subfamily)